MAQIIKRPGKDGSQRYTARVRLRGRQAAKTFGSLKAAQSWARKTEGEIERGKFQPRRKSGRLGTVKDLIERFYGDYLSEYEDSRNLRQRLDWWKGEIGTLPIEDLRPADIAAARDRLKERTNQQTGLPVTASTVRLYLAAISTVLQRAVRDYELISTNPARQVTRPKTKKADPQFIESKEDLDALRKAAAADQDPMAEPLILTALATGMRMGEILRLRWSDVDLMKGLAHIPKTKSGAPRTVRLAEAAKEALKGWSRVRRLTDDRVFPPHDAGRDARSRVNAIWRRLRKTTSGTDVKFHGLRHTAGTWLSQQGFHPVDVARILGHKSLAMSLVYQQLTDQRRDEIARTLDASMFGDIDG